MQKPKIIHTKRGEQHFSVGAIIKKEDKFLIIERKLPPPGFAAIAGHIDEKEAPIKALEREIREETGLDLISQRLLFKKLIIQKEDCASKAKIHKWYVYECKCHGNLNPSKKEVGLISYLTKKQIRKLYKQKRLEYAWVILFKKLNMI